MKIAKIVEDKDIFQVMNIQLKMLQGMAQICNPASWICLPMTSWCQLSKVQLLLEASQAFMGLLTLYHLNLQQYRTFQFNRRLLKQLMLKFKAITCRQLNSSHRLSKWPHHLKCSNSPQEILMLYSRTLTSLRISSKGKWIIREWFSLSRKFTLRGRMLRGRSLYKTCSWSFLTSWPKRNRRKLTRSKTLWSLESPQEYLPCLTRYIWEWKQGEILQIDLEY